MRHKCFRSTLISLLSLLILLGPLTQSAFAEAAQPAEDVFDLSELFPEIQDPSIQVFGCGICVRLDCWEERDYPNRKRSECCQCLVTCVGPVWACRESYGDIGEA